MGIYADILTAARSRLTAIERPHGSAVRPRKSAVFEPLQDKLRDIVFAPDANLAERVAELQFDNRCFLELDVFVGFAVTAEWDEASLYERTDLREQIRLALWRDDLIELDDPHQEFRCDYEPAPGVPPSFGPNSDESWQLFTFTVSTTQNGG
ncbi:MAG TPA: hypothetical protein VF526_15420 [Solirubrobacteraceae bacterium]